MNDVADNQSRRWLAVAAVCGLLAVGLGAFGAHGLKSRVTRDALDVFEVAARYHMYHALAIGLTALWMRGAAHRLLSAAAWAFVVGIVLFSGSLYVFALTGSKWLVAITPIGGVTFLAGWALLLAFTCRRRD